jgi:hypothetical protein
MEITFNKRLYRFISHEEIRGRFYQYVKSKIELEESDSINPREKFYYGDIDADNHFYIGFHGRQQSGDEINNGIVVLYGTIQSDQSGITVLYQYKLNRRLVAIYSIIAFLQFCIGLVTIQDNWLLAGTILIISIVLWGYGVFNPVEKNNLLKMLDMILD